MRIRWHLAGIVPDPQLRRRRFDEGTVPAGATVVVLSPFVDSQIDPLMGTLARTHREVLAVDVLPAPLTMPTDRAELVAARVVVTRWDLALIGVLMRRRQRMRRSA